MSHTPDTLAAAIRRTPLADRLDRCQQIIGTLCAEGRCPKMRIPVTADDEDLVLCQTLEDAATLVSLVREYLACGLTAPEIEKTFELTGRLRELVGVDEPAEARREQRTATLEYDSRKEPR